MAEIDLPELGRRIRAERLRQGVSLRGLARAVGVSASMVSQIETAKSRPSVRTLYAITSMLGLSIEAVLPSRDGALSPVGVGVCLSEAARPVPLVRAHERRVLRLDAGVTWECLAEPSVGAVDFLLVTYAPGAASSNVGELMCHAGFEYGFLQCGRLTLTLDSEEIRLGAGDAVSFASSTPHAYRNDGTRPAVGVWFVDEPCPRGVDRPE